MVRNFSFNGIVDHVGGEKGSVEQARVLRQWEIKIASARSWLYDPRNLI